MDSWCTICGELISKHKEVCFKLLPVSERIAKLWDFCLNNKLNVTELSYGSAGWTARVTGPNGLGESWKHFDPDGAIMGAIKDYKEYKSESN